MSIDLPQPDDIFKFFEKYGEKRGNLTMQILRRQQQFLDAWNSPPGVEIVKIHADKIEEFISKLFEEAESKTANRENLLRLLDRAVDGKKILDKVCSVLNKYSDNIKEVKGQK